MCAEVASRLFGVPHVIARLYNPDHERAYMQLGIDYVCGTSLVAEDIFSKVVSGHGATHRHVRRVRGAALLAGSQLAGVGQAHHPRVRDGARPRRSASSRSSAVTASASSIPTRESILYHGDSVLACVRHELIESFSKYIQEVDRRLAGRRDGLALRAPAPASPGDGLRRKERASVHRHQRWRQDRVLSGPGAAAERQRRGRHRREPADGRPPFGRAARPLPGHPWRRLRLEVSRGRRHPARRRVRGHHGPGRRQTWCHARSPSACSTCHAASHV